MRRAHASLVLSLGLLALVHCGDDSSPSPSYVGFTQPGGSGASGGSSRCAPVGQQVACACPGAIGQAQGAQVCQADGSLGPCLGCPSGQGGASGQGGGAGSSGQGGGAGSPSSPWGAGAAGAAGYPGQPGGGGWGGWPSGGNGGQPGTTDKCTTDCSIYKTPPGSAALPPPPDPGAPPGSGDAVFALRRVYLGEADWDGVLSADAWKQYGFDLDGYSSDVGFGGNCKAIGGGKKADIRVDGQGGIDNSFGKNLMTIFQTFISSPSDEANAGIDKGEVTHLLAVHGLGPGASYSGLSVDFFGPSTGSGVAPTDAQWSSGTTAWHPDPAQLSKPSPPSALSPFSQSYLTNDSLVMKGSDGVAISLFGAMPMFHVRSPIVSIALSPDHKSGAKGILAGYLASDEMIADMKAWGPHLSPALCDPSAFEGIATQMRAASDSLKDGTQDPTRDCDAVSFAMGFDLQIATVATPVAPDFGPSPCSQP